MSVLIWFFSFLLTSLVSFLPTHSSRIASIEITVELNSGKSQGMVHLAIYDSKSSFLKSPCYSTTFVSKSNRFSVPTDELPDGEFAVAAFLDTNGNGKLDSNIFGVPSEPYGFSNNVRGVLGPPHWKDARITLSSSQELNLVLE